MFIRAAAELCQHDTHIHAFNMRSSYVHEVGEWRLQKGLLKIMLWIIHNIFANLELNEIFYCELQNPFKSRTYKSHIVLRRPNRYTTSNNTHFAIFGRD